MRAKVLHSMRTCLTLQGFWHVEHCGSYFFYSLRTFCPHLGSFCVVSSFTMFRPNFTSGLLQVILPRPWIGLLSLVTVFPVITAFHICCLSHHAINKIINSQIKKPHLKMIPIKDNYCGCCSCFSMKERESLVWPKRNRDIMTCSLRDFLKAGLHFRKVGWILKCLWRILFYKRCFHFEWRSLLIWGFRSVNGILKVSRVRSKVDLAVESALSFPLTPMWLGI